MHLRHEHVAKENTQFITKKQRKKGRALRDLKTSLGHAKSPPLGYVQQACEMASGGQSRSSSSTQHCLPPPASVFKPKHVPEYLLPKNVVVGVDNFSNLMALQGSQVSDTVCGYQHSLFHMEDKLLHC